ncbi:exosome complex component RRP45A isoform X1 [Neltuma alba]|uniref:exosome complex component RRP45A isoform X1 n=2 Tax=Neltuma alba TaxID=207710 RepID=UPI0010A58B5E|nr:exosome complex component RRP45A-like isoform X1 [Prosopis alba]XP_028798750.1 exosome complex component RRP45A-like isoform X1 [Prosopis alba]XP_028798751.1 exosome complex component RRP45A-like isoform X1 [Prosopis alba]
MEQRLANALHLTINEKKFIETALLSELRVDGRRPFDYRKLTIKFGREDGSSEVQLGQTHVMAFVTAQLAQPYRDRPNEGSLSIYTEFSPMADPSYEPGRPGEFAVELGRIIDRGLRESRAVDTESLCVLSGKLVWAVRIDIHILDNGGNLVDAANISALAALLTFRRPECTLGGENDQDVVVHPPEVREPLPLIVHHLPIAVTFGFFSNENIVVIDPTHNEEAVMTGRMTATLNANGDVCAVQKAGGEGVFQRVIMHCLQLAHVKAGDITTKIKNAVESYNTERTLQKIKRHSTDALNVSGSSVKLEEKQRQSDVQKDGGCLDQSTPKDEGSFMECDATSSKVQSSIRDKGSQNFIGGPSSWDPYSEGVNFDDLRASLASRGQSATCKQKDSGCETMSTEVKLEEQPQDSKLDSSTANTTSTAVQKMEGMTLKDAVKPKNKRRKKKAASNLES